MTTTPDPLATYLITGGISRVCEELARLMRACHHAGCDGYQLPRLEPAKEPIVDTRPRCSSRHEGGWRCELKPGHTGPHAAGESAEGHDERFDAHPAPTSSPGEDNKTSGGVSAEQSAADTFPNSVAPAVPNTGLLREELERVRAENARLTGELSGVREGLPHRDAEMRGRGRRDGVAEAERLVSELRAELEKERAATDEVTRAWSKEQADRSKSESELRVALAKRKAVGAGAEELRPMFLDAPQDGACKACGRLTTVRVGSDGFCSQCRGFRNIWLYARAHKCRSCNQTLVLENFRIADGCPCNAPRGINHGLVPILTCTCEACDPKQTGSTRYWELTALEQPQAEPGREIVVGSRVTVRGGNMYSGYRGKVVEIISAPIVVRLANGAGEVGFAPNELELASDPPVSEGEG